MGKTPDKEIATKIANRREAAEKCLYHSANRKKALTKESPTYYRTAKDNERDIFSSTVVERIKTGIDTMSS